MWEGLTSPEFTAQYWGGLRIQSDWTSGALVRHLAADGAVGLATAPLVMGEIDEARYKREIAPLRQRLDRLDAAARPLGVERALRYLRETGSLWAESGKDTQREFVREAFARIVVDDAQVMEIAPKPAYSPLFEVDRAERFEDEMGVIGSPGRDRKRI